MNWQRELAADPGPLGAWAAHLLSASQPAVEETAGCAVIEEWPWPQPQPEEYLESCRSLRSALMGREPAPGVVLLAGPEPGCGVSRLARTLAPVWAALPGRSCLLLSTNGSGPGPGLAEFLLGDADWNSVVRRTEGNDQLSRLESGETTLPLADLLARPSWSQLLHLCRTHYDLTIIDGVPATSGPAFDLLCRTAEAVVLVVRTGWTAHAELDRARRRIPPEKLAGLVLNG